MKTESKHTPGPWVYRKQMTGIMGVGRDLYGIGYERDNAVWFVAEHANEEDARLISAAPDLLYAAKDALDSFEYGDDQEAYRKAQAIKTLRAAIAKAEGVS